ncbi:MAG: hypothetical protein WBA44_01295 [Mesorhizobium sp.]
MLKFAKALKRAAAPKADLLTEQQAADWLCMSIFSLRRERKRGNIGFVTLANRARYRIVDLQAYIERMSSHPWPKTVSKSELTTSPATATPPSGKPHGSMPLPDKQSALALAQKTFKTPKSP